ncbi:MAG TPA: methyltransferase domain-containing protein [Candidatus Bathyarchaeia archaeon]|nr:methyltransferase domain-containing protein [Candidatus Bathyarchaeia archaeon]
MFERQYVENECLWGLSPDSILTKNIGKIPVGRALDLGVGEGRNALFLAQTGFQVTGIDISPKAIEKFLNLARERDVAVEGLVRDIRDFEFKPHTYDLIVATVTLHFLAKTEVYETISKIIRSVALGGYVYIGDFTVSDPSYKSAKKRLRQVDENTFWYPDLSCYLYFFSHNELRRMFTDFETKVYLERTLADTPHGKRGIHTHSVALLLAQKCPRKKGL